MAKGPAREGVYSATYSGVPVYEFQFGDDLKEHVMRRRADDWINATHILKAAGFDKPSRTRILEREVQKDVHEKIQGGYGKYQGTWIPLESGEMLAQRNNVYDKLKAIFEFQPGSESPPPAPRHTSKPKAPKAPKAAPPVAPPPNSWENAAAASAVARRNRDEDGDANMNEDDTPDNLTVASASYVGDDDRYDASHFSTGHRKRKREEALEDVSVQQHSMYGDELLDYFLLSRNDHPAPIIRPDPPTNFQPDWPIDTERHTALHWASAMGDVEIIKQLKRFGASLAPQNVRGETPFMRSVNFTNCFEKQTFPQVMKELFSTVDARDSAGGTVIHHAAVMKSGRVTSTSCSRYYLDNILNKLQESSHPDFVQQLLDAQDSDGNTALHLAAMRDARKCIRALLGRGASADIPNNEGVRAEDLIAKLNASKSKSAQPGPHRSSSPFAPDSQRHTAFRDAITESTGRLDVSFQSDAANTVQSKITPLVLQKLQDLSHSYDEELKEKEEAEKQARQVLANSQQELTHLRAQHADLEARIEAEEAATKAQADISETRQKVLAYVTHQNRLAVQEAVQRELSMVNGNGANGQSPHDTPEERLKLAAELQATLHQQRAAEIDYIDARSVLGTSEKIDKFKHLLKSCLGDEDKGMLDENLDDLIKEMEDDAEAMAVDEAGPGEPMHIGPL